MYWINRLSLTTTTRSSDALFCPEANLNGVVVGRTPSCDVVTVPCPDSDDHFRIMEFQCGCDEPVWETDPKFSNCNESWVSSLRSAINRNESAEDIAEQWSNDLRQAVENITTVEDLIDSIDIGQKLLPLARRQFEAISDSRIRSERAYNFTKHFGESGDLLLGDKTKKVWDLMEHTCRLRYASTLMSLLEQSASLMGIYQTESRQQIGFQNWALEVRVKHTYTINDDYESKFKVSPRIKTKIRGRPSLEHDTQSNAISFSNFSKSPVMQMPALDFLSASAKDRTDPEMQQEDMPRLRVASFPALSTMSAVVEPVSLRLGYFLFNSLGTLLNFKNNTIVNSLIIGASVNDQTKSIRLPDDSPVSFVFYHLMTENVANPRCAYWNVTNNEWSQDGCTMLSTTNTSTNCSCNHLTSFAILMDVTGNPQFTLTIANKNALNIITIIGCTLSIICLFIAFLTFTCFRSLWNVRNTIHRNLSLCLLIAELVFVIGIDRTSVKDLCSAIAVILHYIFLCAFCWMLLEGYQLYIMLVHVFEPGNVRIFLYYMMSYSFPAVIVAVSAGLSWHNYGTPDYCWLNVNTPIIWAFAGPVLCVVIANIIFLGIAFKVVLSVKTRDRNRAERVFGWLKGSATLLCLLGVTWIFGFLMAINKTSIAFAYIFTIFNCTQGIFIFVLHVLLNEKVRGNVIRFLRSGLCCASDRKSGYTSRSYITSRQKFLDFFKHSSDATNSDQHRSTNSTGLTPPNPLIEAPPLGEYATNPTAKASAYENWDPERNNDLESATEKERLQGSGRSRKSRANSKDTSSQHSYSSETGSEKRRTAPVRRKKFPLGASDQDRRSPLRTESIIVERF